MKVYTFGDAEKPAVLLLPGTCCHWESNFGQIIPLLASDFRVLCVSYDGFDETERTEFPTMLEETAKIEDWIRANCGGLLAGRIVRRTAGRAREHPHGFRYSRRLRPQSGIPLAAKLQTKLLLPLIYPLIRDGEFKLRFLRRRMAQRLEQDPEYTGAFMRLFGSARPYVSQRSCQSQFYSDLITPLPDGIDVPGTEIHIFYAMKMGEKYRARYLQHFARPVIHELDLQHEELLVRFPERWAALVREIITKGGTAR